MQPRRARLDITKASVSEETQAALLPQPNAKNPKKKSAATVVQTEEVDVAFEGSDYYIVRPHESRDITTYRLRKDAVQAVTWLADTVPAEPKTAPTPAASPSPGAEKAIAGSPARK